MASPRLRRLALTPLVACLLSLACGLPELEARTLFSLSAGEGGDDFGVSVGAAGDVNGDGYADLIVGAPQGGPSRAGRAYVYYGGPGADSNADMVLEGEAAGDRFGESVDGAGDVNADGYSDVIVCAPFNDAGGQNLGRAYVFLGGPVPDSTPDLMVTGGEDERLATVVGVGDVSGDGFDDFLIGARALYARAYLHFGGPHVDDVADLTIFSSRFGEAFAWSAAGTEDVNGDGIRDLIVGGALYHPGQAYLYFGGSTISPLWSKAITGTIQDNNFAWSVSGAGDLNGDGFGDVIVGMPHDITPGRVGAIYVYHGSEGFTDTAPDRIILGMSDEWFGYSADGVGDVSGDGYADMIVGAPNSNAGGNRSGRAMVYLGGPGADDVADLVVLGTEDDELGHSVSAAGDVNGDGYSDMIVGAPARLTSRPGRAYVITAVFPVSLELDPTVLNLAAPGRWITAYLEPDGFDPASIELGTIRLAGTVPAEPKPIAVGDRDSNGNPDLMVKFSRDEVRALLTPGLQELSVTGLLRSGEPFSGSAAIRVLDSREPRSGALTVELQSRHGVAPIQFLVGDLNGGRQEVRVYSVQGRLVSQWNVVGSGTVRSSWNGRTTAGRQAPSGIYILHVRSGDRSGSVKVLLAR